MTEGVFLLPGRNDLMDRVRKEAERVQMSE